MLIGNERSDPQPLLWGSSTRFSTLSASVKDVHETAGGDHLSSWGEILSVGWWFSIVHFCPWWIKQSHSHPLSVSQSYWGLGREQQAKTELARQSSLGELLLLLVDGVALRKTDQNEVWEFLICCHFFCWWGYSGRVVCVVVSSFLVNLLLLFPVFSLIVSFFIMTKLSPIHWIHNFWLYTWKYYRF